MTPEEWIYATRRRWPSTHHEEGAIHLSDALTDIAKLRSERDRLREELERVKAEAVSKDEIRILRDFAARRMSDREYQRIEEIRDAYEDSKAALTPTQEAKP